MSEGQFTWVLKHPQELLYNLTLLQSHGFEYTVIALKIYNNQPIKSFKFTVSYRKIDINLNSRLYLKTPLCFSLISDLYQSSIDYALSNTHSTPEFYHQSYRLGGCNTIAYQFVFGFDLQKLPVGPRTLCHHPRQLTLLIDSMLMMWDIFSRLEAMHKFGCGCKIAEQHINSPWPDIFLTELYTFYRVFLCNAKIQPIREEVYNCFTPFKYFVSNYPTGLIMSFSQNPCLTDKRIFPLCNLLIFLGRHFIAYIHPNQGKFLAPDLLNSEAFFRQLIKHKLSGEDFLPEVVQESDQFQDSCFLPDRRKIFRKFLFYLPAHLIFSEIPDEVRSSDCYFRKYC